MGFLMALQNHEILRWVEEILHHLFFSLDFKCRPLKVVQDFFHQQYGGGSPGNFISSEPTEPLVPSGKLT